MTATTTATAIEYIPFKNLIISPENVRVVSASKAEDAQLIASIDSQGVLQNIIVTPSESKKGQFEVIAGGRRYGAVKSLVENGKLNSDYLFPAKVESREKATEISLSENIKASMHPVDEFLAYKKLADQGKSPKEIATSFGHSATQVKKLLKLGGVAPELLDQFRAGKMSLDAIMAFTVCDEHEKQIACWKELSRGNMYPRAIRQFLLNDSVDDKSPIALFVGVSNYKKAGGAMAVDLFESKNHLLNIALVESMAEEALSQEIEKVQAEGWAWVETSFEGVSSSNQFKKLSAEHVNVPDELNSEIESVNASLSELEDKDIDDWTDDDENKQDELYERLEGLEAKKDNYLQYTPEQMSYSGCVITFNHQGDLIYIRGLARPEDLKARAKELTSNNTGAAANGELLISSEPVESQALISDLNAYYGQAVQAELLKHEDLAFDLMIFSLASKIVGAVPSYKRMLDIHPSPVEYSAIGIHETLAHGELETALASLNTSWLIPESEAERLESFRKLNKKEKTKIMVYCVAKVSIASPKDNSDSGYALVKTQTKFDIRNYWKATSTNYFGRVNKPTLLQIGEDLTGSDFQEKYSKAKKGELAGVLEELPEAAGWIPDMYK